MTFCHFAYTSRRCRTIKGEKDKEKCGQYFLASAYFYEDILSLAGSGMVWAV